ncbi:BRO family protein [Evtepia gabavorous]|jgi:prophage antirepressor-like protein|uniref:BRO family protein n=1 Tax=Evtepia gabavorous TaxID=2211183 RepID=UPI003A3DA8C6
MNELMIFNNPEFGEIRTVEVNGEPWFVGKDVATALGYGEGKSLANAVANHVDEEDKGVTELMTPGGNQKMVIINESGLYSLVLSSKLPGAKRFKRWITSEVIPSIRKHGAYLTPETLEAAILNPDTMIRLCTALKEEQDKRKALEAANATLAVDNQIMRPKADYFDELVDRNLLTSFRETAKQLDVKEKAFVQFLLDKKYIYRDKKGKLMPYADKNAGLFEIKECFNEKTQWSGTQTLITPKGRETFRLLFVGIA